MVDAVRCWAKFVWSGLAENWCEKWLFGSRELSLNSIKGDTACYDLKSTAKIFRRIYKTL